MPTPLDEAKHDGDDENRFNEDNQLDPTLVHKRGG
jgi:hypothetical protein